MAREERYREAMMSTQTTIYKLGETQIALRPGKLQRLPGELAFELNGAHSILAEELGVRWYEALRTGRRELDECPWRVTLLDGQQQVMYDSRSGRTYFTSAGRCTCPGFKPDDPERACYHRALYMLLAVATIRVLRRRELVPPMPTRYPGAVILADIPYIPGVHYSKGVWDGTEFAAIEREKWGGPLPIDPIALARQRAAAINTTGSLRNMKGGEDREMEGSAPIGGGPIGDPPTPPAPPSGDSPTSTPISGR